MMGRNTFETVLGFDGEWPYDKPIVVMSSSLQEIPARAANCEVFSGTPTDVVALANERRRGSLREPGSP